MKHKNSDVTRSMMIPKSEAEALQWLFPLLDLEGIVLRSVGNENFKRGWAAIAFLYPGLHPDSALEEGIISQNIEDYPTLSNADPRLLRPYYKESGWPVVLVPIAREAWRRYEIGGLNDEEFYCSEAQREGICFRNPELF